MLLRGRLHFCGRALTAAISQRPPLETSVMSSDQSAVDWHLLGATSSEWCGFARAEPFPWSAGPACAHFPALRRPIPRSAWHALQRRPAAHSPRPQREVAFPTRLTPGAKPSAESHARAASVVHTRRSRRSLELYHQLTDRLGGALASGQTRPVVHGSGGRSPTAHHHAACTTSRRRWSR